jgi:hypothetical protein
MGTTGSVRALVVGRRVHVGKDLLDTEVGKPGIAVIEQKQRLSPIAHQHQGVVWDMNLVHEPASW